MIPRSVVARRLASVLCVAVLAAAAWWLLWRSEEVGGGGDGVARPAPEDTSAPPLRLDPVLRGAAGAEPPPAAGEPTRTEADPLTWRITFDVVGPDGAPCPWDAAEFRGGRGVPLEHVRAGGHVTPGVLDVRGKGRLVVWAEGFVPWMSDGLTRPVAGGHHVVARLDSGLAVAGEVFEQDGRTPLAAGSVLVTCSAATLPDGSSFGQQGDVENGRFRIAGLVPGSVDVRVRGGHSRAGQPAQVRAEAGDEDLRIVLRPWGWVTLLVVDARTGFAPVTSYLQVFEVDDEGVGAARLTTTTTVQAADEEPTPLGGFDAAPGARLRFRVDAQGYEPTEVIEVVVPATGGLVEARVELRPAPGSSVRLRIRLVADSAPLPGWRRVRHLVAGGGIGHSHPVEEDVVTLDLVPGEHRLTLEDTLPPREKGPYWLPAEVTVELAPGEERETEARLHQGGWVFVPGSIQPVPALVRWLCGADTRETDVIFNVHGGQTGYFLGLLPPGRWTLWYGAGDDARTGVAEVRAGEVTTLDPQVLRRVGGDASAR